jgi:hypothetical protein
VIGEKAGYLSEDEDEDQVEEQFERGDALLVGVPALYLHTRRASRAHLMPLRSRFRFHADAHILASAAGILHRPNVQVFATCFRCSGE